MVWKPGDKVLPAGVFRGRVPDEAFVVDDVFKPFLRKAWPKIVHLTWLGLTPEAICDSLERDVTETIVLDYVRAVRNRLGTRQDVLTPHDDDAAVSRGYRQADKPLLDEMAEMIRTGTAKSANNAAAKVADRAKGNSREAKIDRLARRYRAERKRGISGS